MSSEVTEIINTLCEKLGVAADILVPEMARYNIARLTFQTVVETVLAVVMAVVVVRLAKWSLSNEDADWDGKVVSVFLTCLVPGVVMVFLTCSAIARATDLIGWVVSPTASAVREITSLIK